jgi:(1->4)-alpha-D-glucan 1-alpha-D-glucosylmutase
MRINKDLKYYTGKEFYSSNNDEYFLYQTLIGSYPFNDDESEKYINRIKEYIVKAVREARINSSWVLPNNEYEKAYTDFSEKILKSSDQNEFLKDFIPFQKKVAHYGVINSIAQAIIKITSPGIPDFYQGTELWDFSLVDPDNRRPIDYKLRDKLLSEIKQQSKENISECVKNVCSNVKDGRIKLFSVYNALKARNKNINVFQKGSYQKLEPKGERKTNIFSFARNFEDKWIVVVVPRFCTELVGENEFPVGQKVWKDTQVALPSENLRFKNIFTDEDIEDGNKICISAALKTFPAAVLISQ